MCLPFSCGGGDKGDDGSHDPSLHQHPRLPQQPPPPPGTTASVYVPQDEKEDNGQPYNKPPHVKEEAHGHGHNATMVPAGGHGMNGGGRAAQAGHAAPTTPATTQGFINKHRDQLATQQAPHQRVSASPRGHGSSAGSHPSEAATDHMKAPLPVQPMARRPGGEDYY